MTDPLTTTANQLPEIEELQRTDIVIIARGDEPLGRSTAGAIVDLLGTLDANNIRIGDSALDNLTSGQKNVAVGPSALRANEDGEQNIGIGIQALGSNISGSDNFAMGAYALVSLTTGSGNSAIGSEALFYNQTGFGNVAFGLATLFNNIGDENVGLGYEALNANTSGSRNIGIGRFAGDTDYSPNANLTGSNNVYIGYASGPGVATQLDNAIGIGSGARTTKSNQVVLGNTDITETFLNGDVLSGMLGRGFRVAEGSNCKQGIAVLVAGVVVVANTSITANSRIFIQRQTDGGTVGASYSITRTPETSFTITSKDGSGATQAADTSTVAFEIFEPA